MTAANKILKLRDINKSYQGLKVLQDLNLDVLVQYLQAFLFLIIFSEQFFEQWIFYCF